MKPPAHLTKATIIMHQTVETASNGRSVNCSSCYVQGVTLNSIINEEQHKKHLCQQSSHYEKYKKTHLLKQAPQLSVSEREYTIGLHFQAAYNVIRKSCAEVMVHVQYSSAPR